ncbi:MAG: undecaprenyl/decaprenyl-phosphate alpha-N-acetylglucosaminyl 1-phosphate transferase [Chloroflexi bacterium]|nr:undecaprenyl/decaprenyl-phosphate alpha-N-acetylglucosaminyl 1-phosphate transferase [Chloroflexota bacterium]
MSEAGFTLKTLLTSSWWWIVLIVGFALSVAFCRGVDAVARHFEWLDMPSPRRIHRTPKPRLGGIGMLLAYVPLSIVVAVHTLPPSFIPQFAGGLACAVLIAAIMIADDIHGLSPATKLGAQLVVAALAFLFGLRIDHVSTPLNNPLDPNPLAAPLTLPLFLAVPVTLLWFTGMINAVNALDGVDGLAGGVVAIAAAALGIHTLRYMTGEFGVAQLLLLLTAVCCGFLVWNWPPSRLIMGDTGSHFLGYLLSMLSILGGARLATALLVLGIPILDYAYTIYTRARTGRAPMHFDLGHLHHRLLSAGYTPPMILGLLYAITAIAGIAALFLEKTQKLFGFLLLLVIAFAVIVLLPQRPRRPRPPEVPQQHPHSTRP